MSAEASALVIADVFVADISADAAEHLFVSDLFFDFDEESDLSAEGGFADVFADAFADVDFLLTFLDAFVVADEDGVAFGEGDAFAEVVFENRSEEGSISFQLDVAYLIVVETTVGGSDSAFASALADLAISLDAPGDIVSLTETVTGNNTITVEDAFVLDIELDAGESKTLSLEAFSSVLAETDVVFGVGKSVTLLAGASSAPNQTVSFEVLINGESFGRSMFSETTNVTSSFRANAPVESFEFQTEFDEITSVSVIFDEDAGPIVNDGFDINILVDSVIISSDEEADLVLTPSQSGFYDGAADRGRDANSGDMFWNGTLTISNPDALIG